MGDIIHLGSSQEGAENIILRKPLEMRWGDWHGGFPIQVYRPEARRFEAYRESVARSGHFHAAGVPSHFVLRDGLDTTFWALWRWKQEPDRMREVYYLAGLMECVTHVPHSVLRSVMIRPFYRHLMEVQEALDVRWRGRVHHFLFPMGTQHRGIHTFRQRIQEAESLRKLLEAIREETQEEFLILGSEYVFYVPRPRIA